jgi:hypothetical protein
MTHQREVSVDEVARLLVDPSLPSSVRQALQAGSRLERIELDHEGIWRHQGDPIEHPHLSALFHRSLHRQPSGTYLLHIPPLWYPITVADAPRQVRHVRLPQADAASPHTVTLLLSDGSEQALDPSSLRYVEGHGLYCLVTAPDGERWPARFLRPAYYSLLELLIEEQDSYFLVLPEGRFPVKIVDESHGPNLFERALR